MCAYASACVCHYVRACVRVHVCLCVYVGLHKIDVGGSMPANQLKTNTATDIASNLPPCFHQLLFIWITNVPESFIMVSSAVFCTDCNQKDSHVCESCFNKCNFFWLVPSFLYLSLYGLS